jgi:hypothetical protein
MAYSEDIINEIEELAFEYVQECLNNTKPHVAGNGKVINVPDRHIPTIDYFLRIWIPIKKGMELINRRTWYRWLDEESDKCHTIKNIDGQFIALGKNIVANEGKGIFYAKNKFGMHDRQQVETRNVDKFDFEQ